LARNGGALSTEEKKAKLKALKEELKKARKAGPPVQKVAPTQEKQTVDDWKAEKPEDYSDEAWAEEFEEAQKWKLYEALGRGDLDGATYRIEPTDWIEWKRANQNFKMPDTEVADAVLEDFMAALKKFEVDKEVVPTDAFNALKGFFKDKDKLLKNIKDDVFDEGIEDDMTGMMTWQDAALRQFVDENPDVKRGVDAITDARKADIKARDTEFVDTFRGIHDFTMGTADIRDTVLKAANLEKPAPAPVAQAVEEGPRTVEQIRAEMKQVSEAPDSAEIHKLFNQAHEDLSALVGRMRHTYGLPDDPEAITYRLQRQAMNLNTLRFMGMVAVSSIPDLARFTMKFGPVRTFRDGLVPLIRNFKTLKLSAREAKLAGEALDVVLHTRMYEMMDLMDEFASTTKVERGLDFLTSKIGVVGLFDYWNSGLKQFAGVLTNAQILDSIKEIVEGGKLVGNHVNYLAGLNIDGPTAEDIWRLVQNGGGGKVNGVWLPNTEDWRATAERLAREEYPNYANRMSTKRKVPAKLGKDEVKVFHGTGKDFDAPRPYGENEIESARGQGFYVTESSDSAAKFAKLHGGESGVVQEYGLDRSAILDAGSYIESQPLAVQEGLIKIAKKYGLEGLDDLEEIKVLTGQEFFEELQQSVRTGKEISEAFSEAGITGFRHVDEGGFDGAVSGAMDTIVFDVSKLRRLREEEEVIPGLRQVDEESFVAQNVARADKAMRVYRAALVREVNATIVTPGIERPLIFDKSIGWKMLMQFKSFGMTSTYKVMMAGLQENPRNFALGTAQSLGLAALSYYLYMASQGRGQEALDQDWDVWADEMIDRSGMLAVFGFGRDALAAVPWANDYVMFSGEQTERRGGTGLANTALGPTGDLLFTATRAFADIDDPTGSTLHQIRKMMPFQNVWWLRKTVFDPLEEGTQSALGIPDERG
jgi:hypothetical protein